MRTTPKPKNRPRDVAWKDPQTADELSQAVACIVKRLRSGQTVSLPGVGDLLPGKKTRLVSAGAQEAGGKPVRKAGRRES